MPTIQNVTKELLDRILQDDFKPSEIKFALLIFRMTTLEDGSEWTKEITIEELETKLKKMKRASIKAAIKKLKARNIIETSRHGGGANSYRISPMVASKPSSKKKRLRRQIRGITKS